MNWKDLMKTATLLFVALFAFAACSDDDKEDPKPVAENAALLTFGFYQEDNAGVLSKDYVAQVPAVSATATSYNIEIPMPSVVDKSFTARMETRLDEVEEGKVDWKNILRDFYPDFEKAVEKAEKEIEKVKIEDEVTDVICENCGRNMVVKFGPHGKFLACPGFPECRNTKPYLEKIGVTCPKCGRDIVARRTKKGRRFYGCEDYPTCDFMSWQRPVKKQCPDCGGYMVIKGKNIVCADPECGHVEKRQDEDTDE